MNPRKGLTLLSATLLLTVGACVGSGEQANQSAPPSADGKQSTDSEAAQDSESAKPDKPGTGVEEPEPATTEIDDATNSGWPTCDDIAAVVPEFIAPGYKIDNRDMPPEFPEGQMMCSWSLFYGEPGEPESHSNLAFRRVSLLETTGIADIEFYKSTGLLTSPSAAEALGGFAYSENKKALADPVGTLGSGVAFNGYIVTIQPEPVLYPNSPGLMTHGQAIDVGMKVYQELLQ